MVSVVNATGNNDIDGILWGWKWDSTNIEFSFPDGTAEYLDNGYEDINGFQQFNATQQTAVRNILANVASFTNLTFTETTADFAILRYAEADSVNYTNDSNVAQQTGLHTIGTAEANPPELGYMGGAPFAASYAQGDSWYNHTSYNNSVPGSFGYAAGIMHETGHNLGLKHGHATQNGHGTLFPTLPADHNSYEYSVMTYSQFPGDTGSGDNAPDHPTTFMINDILALQYMYGANYGFNSGNNVYTWSPLTGRSFVDGVGGLTPDSNFILMTVWDGGGTDTYDFSNYTTDLEVDLQPGGWTTVSDAQLADLGNNGAGGPNYIARGNIANAMQDPNNPTETASLIENATGGSGDDSIVGNVKNNTLKGGGGGDQLYGLEGNDFLQGDAGDDTLKGGGGVDTLYGLDDDDTLKGGGGADSLIGGGGIDTANYLDSAAGTVVSLASGTGSGGDAEGDTLSGIENLHGSIHTDWFVGDGNVNNLSGDDGDDILKGAGGADAIDGGDGIDFAGYDGSGAGVSVSLLSGTGFGGDAEGDTLADIENLGGSGFNDFLTGSGAANALSGLGGDDLLKGGGGADSLNGGTAIDTASYLDSGAGVSVSLATGNGFFGTAAGDTLTNIENLMGSGQGDSLYGNTGANRLKGAGGADYLYGADGDDTLEGSAGGDTMDGWNGVDTLDYSASSAGVSINVQTGAAAGGDAAGDSFFNMENVTGSAYADTLAGNAAANTLAGGGGVDTVSYAGAGAGVTVNLSLAAAQNTIGAGIDTLSQLENLIGSNFSDTLLGNSAANIISGGDGIDTMSGAGGNDSIAGEIGNDTLRDGTGADSMSGGADDDRFYLDPDAVNDTVAGDAGTDTLDLFYATSAANVLFGGIAFAGTASGGGLGSDSFTSIERIFGGLFGDTITGGGGGETVTGRDGNDTFRDGGGADSLNGGNNDDRFYLDADGANDSVFGDANTDTLDLFYATGATNVQFIAGTASGGGLGANSFAGIERLLGSTFADTATGGAAADYVFGRAGSDSIFGGQGNDTIYGDTGSDRLTGAAGADYLHGGADADTFVFTHVSQGADTFGDFTTGADSIEIARAGFGLAPGYALNFQVGAVAVGAGQVFLYNAATHQFSFDSNGAAAGGTTLLATLSVGSVAAGDIVLV